jgi:hypothetical protein
MSNFFHQVVFGTSLVNIAAALGLMAGINRWRKKYFHMYTQHIEDYKTLLVQHKELWDWYLRTKRGRTLHRDS